MPHAIVAAETLAPAIRRFRIHAPHVVRHCGPGQFVTVRTHPGAERIPLTVAWSDASSGDITLVVQAVGASTRVLCDLQAGDVIENVAGPMGAPTEVSNFGHAVLVGGGVGTAVIYPQAKALRDAGNRVTAIIGGRSRDYVIFEQELSAFCETVLPCTDDGSYGFHGLVTARLKQLLDIDPVQYVICAGPVPMMRAVAETTRPYGVHTVASLNPIMVDGTGMCGGCRVQVGGQMRFACVEGPEFDAHQVDFQELATRLTAYKTFERSALEALKHKGGGCHQ